MQKRTKIVCTLGPSSGDQKTIERMVKAGMNVARLNFSHGTYEDHARLAYNVRSVAKRLGVPVAIMQDLQGPKLRVGELPREGLRLKKRQKIIFSTAKVKKGGNIIAVQYPDLHRFVRKGDTLLLSDGNLDVRVESVRGRLIHCIVGTGGTLFSNKGINIPKAKVIIPSITAKDKRDADFGVRLGVDFIALSFVQTAADVEELRKIIRRTERQRGVENKIPRDYKNDPAATRTKIVVKIEKPQAVKNIDRIIEETDAVMVARGDLGIEMPLNRLPIIQKDIIKKCLVAAKPVIVATQMLKSMEEKPRPTRAEVSDVANAVMDHTDAVMLSEETAMGKFPVKTVQTMARIIQKAEKSPYDDLLQPYPTGHELDIDEAVSRGAWGLSRNLHAQAVLVATVSGRTGRVVSSYRPELPIIVTAPLDQVQRQLALSWSVEPLLMKPCASVDQLIDRAVRMIKRKKMVKKGDKVIIVAGQPVGKSGNVNLLKIQEI